MELIDPEVFSEVDGEVAFFDVSVLVVEWCANADLVLVEAVQPLKPNSNKIVVEFNKIFCTLVLSMIGTPFEEVNQNPLFIYIVTLLKHLCKECYN